MPGEQILSTKLVGPEPHPAAVDRVAALDWVDAEVEAGGAVVLSTLAGSGRLELLARWASRQTSAPTTWLRLDAWDDLARYARHLIAALQRIDQRTVAQHDRAGPGEVALRHGLFSEDDECRVALTATQREAYVHNQSCCLAHAAGARHVLQLLLRAVLNAELNERRKRSGLFLDRLLQLARLRRGTSAF